MIKLIKQWRIWFGCQPWSFRWFLWLILLRPIIDIFYFLKFGGGFSPLQVVGVLAFFICLKIIIEKRIKLKPYDYCIAFFGILLILNFFAFFIGNLGFSSFGFFLKSTFPILLFFYLRRVIKSRSDMEGVLITFLIASILPYTIFFYEFIFSPIKMETTSESRGSLIRLSGLYADLFNYLANFIGDFIVISYFLLKRKIRFTASQFFLFISIIFAGVIGISHSATWGVFLALFLLLLYYSKGINVIRRIIPVLLISLVLGGGVLLNNYLTPLFGKEISVYSGELNQDKALNGRVGRWKKNLHVWGNMSNFYKLLGIGTSNHPRSEIMMSGGMHSDYVRFLFSTGIIGLSSYLLFYISMFRMMRRLKKADLFLFTATLITMLLYALSANPFGLSGSLLYICLTSFAFLGINKNRIYYEN